MIWKSPGHCPQTLQEFLQYYERPTLAEVRDWELMTGLRAKSLLPTEDKAEIVAELHERHFNWLCDICAAENWQTTAKPSNFFASQAFFKAYDGADLFDVDPLGNDNQKNNAFRRWLRKLAMRYFLTELATERSEQKIKEKYCSEEVPEIRPRRRYLQEDEGDGLFGQEPQKDNDHQDDEEQFQSEQEQTDKKDQGQFPIISLPLPAPRLELLEYLFDYLDMKVEAGEQAEADFLLTSVKYEVLGPARKGRLRFEIEKDILKKLCENLKRNADSLRKLRLDLLEEAEAYIRRRVRIARGGLGFLLAIEEKWPKKGPQGASANENKEAI